MSTIAFTLAQRASAWDFSGNTDPWKIVLTADALQPSEMPMNYSEADKGWSTAVFTPTTESVQFSMRLYYGEPGSDNSFTIGNSNYTATPDGGWVSAQASNSSEDDERYHRFGLSGLCPGSTYRIDFTGDTSKSFRYRVTEVHDRMYLYTISGDGVEQVAEAANDNGKFAFSLDLRKDMYLFLSRNQGASTWEEMQADGGRFNPDGTDVKLPTEGSEFIGNTTSGSWQATNTGRYTVTADWIAMTLSATNEMYLYGSAPQWATKIAGATPTEYGKYTFTADLEAGEYIVLSEKSDGHDYGDIMKFNWAPEEDTEIVNNELTGFSKKESGAWIAPKAGKYAIEVDWENKTFKAFAVSVNLPLKSVDFAGGKKHYFLVGERMGEWHLQPEWELKEADGALVLNNRYIYNGAFAVGVVDNYADYASHTFTYYCSGMDFTTATTSSAGDISGTGRVYRQQKGKTRYNPSDVFYAKFDGEDRYFDGRGTFMSEIRVNLNGNGLPTSISFVKGSDAEAARQRVFTLVGDNIINRNFSNTSGTGNTTMYNRAYSGWFDSWIQYDPATNAPYVDANGEYLYHTSFTPDYLTAHPVQFNLELPDGSEFAYTSGNIQFVEWSNLPNLDSDPYKDFYRAFSGRETISDNGALKAHDGYNFIVNVECDNKETTPNADWSCYVVRDMWVGGQIKFWTGWGGNEDATNNGYNHLAVWHGPNGGPDVTADTNHDVRGYDVKSGLKAVLYKNVARRGNTNYRISDGKPVYFNRVVLWYNNTDGVSNSYIQFIQESAGPAIFAETVTNETDTSKKNYIRYHWYLNKSQNETGSDLRVVSYEIRRYRVVDGKPQPAGYPEGEKVMISDVCDHPVYVRDLYEENAGNLGFTSHIDKGILDNRGFAPGLYEYDIYVTDEEGGRKLAVSNRVAIYDDALVTPNVVAMQLVELRDAYEDKYGTYHAASATVLSEALANAGLGTATAENKRYLTYRVNDNDNFYIMEDIVDAEGRNVPVGVEIIDSRVALDFLDRHPDKYQWTSDYYVRCLDYNRYAGILQSYIDNKMIKETEIPEPRLEVFDVILPDNGGEAVRRPRGNASRFDFGGQTYYSAIVKRGGNLADATFDVTLNYDYTPSDATEAVSPTTNAATEIDPVVPRPFNPLYRYVYDRPERTMSPEYEWGKIKVPVRNWKGHSSTGDAILAGDTTSVYVRLDKHFDPRTFTLQIDFYRPNVNEEIYKFYDIRYHINMVNDDSDIVAELAVPLDIEAVLHDEDIADADAVTPNRYRMELKGLHPRNGVYPKIDFVKTEYIPNSLSSAETGEVYKSQTGNFGKMLSIKAARSTQITEHSEGIGNVHLGKIRRDNGKWDWMYKGHEYFKDNDPMLVETGTEYEDATGYDPAGEDYTPIKPVYYLFEVTNGRNDEATYKFLVPHTEGHHTGETIETDPKTGLILNDSDPLIGTYIARDFNHEDNPTLYATAIYIFERPLNGTDTGDFLNFNRLEVVSLKVNGNETSSAGRSHRLRDVSFDDFALNGCGDLPNAGYVPTEKVLDMSAPDKTTGYNGYIAVKGPTYRDASGGIVTGVEDVIAENGEQETVYYNMQGMRIEKPTEAGVYFRAVGNKVSKFIIR